ncbi:MAG: undecaprenyldiphospho-muramoylpentapeptide beta-N-acetylglucosaminyltransferase [Clostridiaceae bacterium]
MYRYKIIMTGGGSAGHVTPNLALIPFLRKEGFEIKYIGGKDGIEKGIIEGEGIPFYGVSTGKLRRYFDLKNFTDPFKVIAGIGQCYKIIKKEKPNIVFSKGGFVAVPVVLGAYLNKVPVVSHESDITPGLANKLIIPYCSKLCLTFPEAMNHVKKEKAVITGTPIREELFKGKKEDCLRITGFTGRKPILLIIGGSLGSKVLNDTVRSNLKEILNTFDIIHLCGKGNIDGALTNKKGYKQYEYVNEEMSHFLMGCDMVISRAGANSIFELLALKKPNILIPLSQKASRGDQILNAKSFEKKGYSYVIEEDDLRDEVLKEAIMTVYKERAKYISSMEKSEMKNGSENILKIILENIKK